MMRQWDVQMYRALLAALVVSTGCADCGGDAASVDGRDMTSTSRRDMQVDAAPAERVCDDAIDDDGDGLVDCVDPDCDGQKCASGGVCMTAECVGGETSCDDAIDEDNDRLIDCEDSDCVDSCACRDCEELCDNGLDDNGNGVIDDGCACDFKGLNQGVCMRATIDFKQVCRPATGYQTNETLCDGADNDCDGVVDEGCPCLYEAGTTGVCLFASVGLDGQCARPFRHQVEETACDGFDNDCDGATDEGCALCTYQDITRGVCVFGQVGADATECLPPEAYSSTETHCVTDPKRADGVDNDCDGVVDEGCLCPYQGSSQGVCRDGLVDATSGLCSAPLGYELQEATCDGRDNDCDGQIDEQCERCEFVNPNINNSGGKGVCQFGQPNGDQCEQPAGYASDERECVANLYAGDGRDNDCDGVVDEGCACPYNGLRAGVCAQGVIDALEGNCTEPGGYEQIERACSDGVDNDCDDRADQVDLDCRPTPGTELYCDDDLDNDQDGLKDCADGDCARAPNCQPPADMGQSDMAPDMPPAPEGMTCASCYDGLDNDGDGFFDCDDQDCHLNGQSSFCMGPGSQGYGCSGEDTLELCHDGMDNDDDRMIDCDDPECSWSGLCVEGPPGTCDNNIDEDDDGLVDCLDPDCQTMSPCLTLDMGGGPADMSVPDLGGPPDMGTPDFGLPPFDMSMVFDLAF